jgi:hypothetical protein
MDLDGNAWQGPVLAQALLTYLDASSTSVWDHLPSCSSEELHKNLKALLLQIEKPTVHEVSLKVQQAFFLLMACLMYNRLLILLSFFVMEATVLPVFSVSVFACNNRHKIHKSFFIPKKN